jgi:hypothetical protein
VGHNDALSDSLAAAEFEDLPCGDLQVEIAERGAALSKAWYIDGNRSRLLAQPPDDGTPLF